MQETNKGMAMQLFEIVIQLGLHVYVICILQNQYCMAIDIYILCNLIYQYSIYNK